MSFLSWTPAPVVHFQALIGWPSFDPPPWNRCSDAEESIASVMNSLWLADDVPALTWSQSSPAAAWLVALPSSSKRPSSWTARAGDARAKLKYCNRSDNTKSADHDRARLRRVRAPMKCQSPRDAMSSSPSPRMNPRWMKPSMSECSAPEVPGWNLEAVNAGLKAGTFGPQTDPP